MVHRYQPKSYLKLKGNAFIHDRPQEDVRFLPSSIPDIYVQQRLKNKADLKDKSSYQPENLPVVSPESLHTF